MNAPTKIITVLQKGFHTQKEIMAMTGASQATVSRTLNKLTDELLTLTETRPTQYALPFAIDNSPSEYVVFEFDVHGKHVHIGYLYTLQNGQFFVKTRQGTSSLYLGLNKNGLYDALPFFLDDLRPQGFIGNQIAKQLYKLDLGYPKNLTRWSPRNILNYLVEYGDNLPGNIKFSDGAFKSMQQPVTPISIDDYDYMCEQLETGQVPQSSAAGEQQKFTAFNKELNSHVLVKFTSNQNDPLTRRWKDILVTEFHALKTLTKFKIPAADVQLITKDNRYYLETKRFDRIGTKGRSSMFSLMAIDLEFIGLGENWLDIFEQMVQQNIAIESDQYYISFLWNFSKWIGNTDTHLGNISFGMTGDRFSLLPIYDMCTMGIAPSRESIKPISLNLPPTDVLTMFSSLKSPNLARAVQEFWQSVLEDERISDEFRYFIKNDDVLKSIISDK